MQLLKRVLRLPYRQTIAYAADRTWIQYILQSGRRKKYQSDRVVLLIDMTLPMPDKDAGSRNTLEHIKTLIQLGYNVHFWPRDGIDHPRYADALRRYGVQVHAGYFRMSLKSWILKHKDIIKAIFIHRPAVAARYINEILATGAPAIYYGHDLHFARLNMEAGRTGEASDYSCALKMQHLEQAIWNRVRVSTYPTQEEITTVRELCPAVRSAVLPAFCFDNFETRTSIPPVNQIMFVGSFRHPPNVQAAVWLAREIFPKVCEQIPDARLLIAGSNPSPEIQSLKCANVDVLGWVTEERLGWLYESSKVSVVPLTVGAGMKLKVVEALVKGTPLVTTSVGAQGLPDLHDVSPVFDDPGDIANAISQILRESAEDWMVRSTRQTEYAKQHFSRDSMKTALQQVIELASMSTPLVTARLEQTQ